ncbi:MAG: aminoacyl-tRNA hydrolase [Ignavibacteria bacterium]
MSPAEKTFELINITERVHIPFDELTFRFARSGGPGGQNVNKVASRVELLFDVGNSLSLSEEDKRRVFDVLRKRIDRSGILHLTSQQSRSQWKNRLTVMERFAQLLRTALIPRRDRIPTEPTTASQTKRVHKKKLHAIKKRGRKKVRDVEDL